MPNPTNDKTVHAMFCLMVFRHTLHAANLQNLAEKDFDPDSLISTTTSFNALSKQLDDFIKLEKMESWFAKMLLQFAMQVFFIYYDTLEGEPQEVINLKLKGLFDLFDKDLSIFFPSLLEPLKKRKKLWLSEPNGLVQMKAYRAKLEKKTQDLFWTEI